MDEQQEVLREIDADVDGKLATALFFGTILVVLALIYALVSAA